MIVGVLITGGVGLLLSVIGWLIWSKEKISLLHEYHYRNVKPEDRFAFCLITGQGLGWIGGGLLISAVLLAVTESILSFLAFGVGLFLGLLLIRYAEHRYNR